MAPWAAVEAFLHFVGKPQPVAPADLREVVRLLDALAMARHACPSAESPDDDGLEPAANEPGEARRKRLCVRFPGLGYYDILHPSPVDILCSEPGLGDAIDDLLDIEDELRTALWYRDHGQAGEGERFLAWSFDVHWGQHLRDLQLFLHAVTRDLAG